MRRSTLALFLLPALSLFSGCDKSSPVAPEGTTLTINANPVTIPTNGTSTITVSGRKGNGLPLTEGTLIRFSTTIGSIDASVAADRDGIARATLRGDGRAGKAKVQATTGAIEAVETEIEIGSPGASITLQADRSNLPESGGSILLQANVRDPQGQAQPQAQVNFSTPLGRLSSGGGFVLTDGGGIARDTLSVTEADLRTFNANKFEIKAEVGGAEGAVKEDTVEISIGTPVGSIILQADPTSLPQSGGSVKLSAAVRSTQGRPIEGARVTFTTEAGDLASNARAVFTNQDGDAFDTLRITAEQVAGLADDKVTVKAQSSGTDGALKEASAEVTVGARAASITVQPTPASVPETGGSVELLATVRSTTGPLPGAAVNFGADIGTLQSKGTIVFTDRNGQVRDRLTVTEDELAAITADRFNVSAQVGSSTGSLLTDSFELRITRAKPVANFVPRRVSNTAVLFENTTTGSRPITYQWDFQGDNVIDSTVESPTHDYGATGSYTVRLTATNSAGDNSKVSTVVVPVP
jgi:PKD repeat protein